MPTSKMGGMTLATLSFLKIVRKMQSQEEGIFMGLFQTSRQSVLSRLLSRLLGPVRSKRRGFSMYTFTRNPRDDTVSAINN